MTPARRREGWPQGAGNRQSKRGDGDHGGGSASLEDGAGRIRAGPDNGLSRLPRSAAGGGCVVELMYRDPSRSRTWVETLYLNSRGRVLAAMQPHIGEFSPDARAGDPPNWRYTYSNGLVDTQHTAIAEDIAGNVWIG